MGNSKYFEDEKLLEQLTTGDDRIWKGLYNDIREPFRAYFLKNTGIKPDEAVELFHKVMIIFHRKVVSGGLTPPLSSKLKTYIIGIGKNVARQQGFKELGDDEFPEIPVAPVADTNAEAEENARKVKGLLQMMGDRCREVLELFYIKGYSMDAIETTMSFSSYAAAKKKKFDCLKAIRNKMS